MVLYVDDDSDDIEIFQEALSLVAPARRFIIARNGKDALTILRAGILPSYIFLDINMPLMNGHEALCEIRKMKECADIKVVMFTTSDRPEDKELALKNGADGYIHKPSSFDALCKILKQVDALA